MSSQLTLSKSALQRATKHVRERAAKGDRDAQRVVKESDAFRQKLARELQLTEEELNRRLR